MCLLQNEDEYGYKMTERLQISAERQWKFSKKIIKEDELEEMDR
jgi:hypothetical protein